MSTQESVIGKETSREDVFSPAVDIEESRDDIVVWADLPGVKESDLRVTIDKNVLTVQARTDADERPTYRLSHREYGVGEFRRVFTLSDAVDQKKIAATLKDGVLKLVLPKVEPAKPRTIPVKTTE